jgi:hypothetical protein
MSLGSVPAARPRGRHTQMLHEPNIDQRLATTASEGALHRRAFLKRGLALAGALAGSAGMVARAAAALPDLASPDAAPAARSRRRPATMSEAPARPTCSWC